MNTRRAFTLIEMLVVMAIMAIIAAMVVGMAVTAKNKQHQSQVAAGLTKIRSAIDAYQSKLNFFPQDNGNLAGAPLVAGTYTLTYDAVSAVNPLIYELMGGTNDVTNASGSGMQLFGTNQTVSASNFKNTFGRTTLQNAATADRDQSPTAYLNPGPKPNEYGPLTTDFTTGPGLNFNALTVPVPTVINNKIINSNFWHYDASSTNRHNQGSYDLWAEYTTGTKNGVNIVVTNGNW